MKEDVLAAAWGRADPEPFEEFSTGTGTGSTTSSIYGSYDFAGKDARAPPAAAPRHGRPSIPPPLPLDLPGSPTAMDAPSSWGAPPESPTATRPGALMRSKSLIQRIRGKRDGGASSVPSTPPIPDLPERPGQPCIKFLTSDPGPGSELSMAPSANCFLIHILKKLTLSDIGALGTTITNPRAQMESSTSSKYGGHPS
ncbi:hypothetical protein BOTBODRAFT_186625 [Botryobasidium botryosum FD-172 SS1]|uniref:Uncharacterized protein n=1 Tax=Botryobasidium botryosum (strain FD-172 SS1) TaxID=930990 RepID=A0A067MKG9_BOTB1|nr:hypothetical protein BOTBODRAFT_186625 [Botryobasidium botryosum FD-172 SS1]